MCAPRFHALTAGDGSSLMMSDWPLDSGRVRGVVLIVHGLGEHAGRYGHVARRLNRWGFAVRAYDQYGHGESTGARGALPQADRLLTDLTAVVEQLRTQRGPDTPLILLGHSLGGLVVARFVALSLCPVQA
ncbi:MAG: alpha/beta fold hydrolase, partial [Burkholderiaceae bacterium]